MSASILRANHAHDDSPEENTARQMAALYRNAPWLAAELMSRKSEHVSIAEVQPGTVIYWRPGSALEDVFHGWEGGAQS